ncbi:hypothetical protein JOE61_003059 [Nocardioides salarius]|uniref:Uncharacterized protein n=1 Tax=Nocardioides salarius TaxID=374513 RepID=A0ABS2MDH7_9ACTN|nr:hypothetical protein [Nocardioides salarius]
MVTDDIPRAPSPVGNDHSAPNGVRHRESAGSNQPTRRTQPLVEQRGPKARATPRPSESMAYGEWSRTTSSGPPHVSRMTTPRQRRTTPRAGRFEPADSAHTAVGRAARAEGSSDAETPQPHGVRRVVTDDIPRAPSPVEKDRSAPTAYDTASRPVRTSRLGAHSRWSSSEGRRLERRRDPATARRTASGHGRHPPGPLTCRKRPLRTNGVGNRESAGSNQPTRRTQPLVEQRGPKARATPRPSESMAYGEWSRRTSSGPPHVSRMTTPRQRRTTPRAGRFEPADSASGSLTGSRRRSSLALVTARPTRGQSFSTGA